MALSATISLSPASAPYNSKVTVLVLITNTGASAVTLQTLSPQIGSNTSLTQGSPAQGIVPLSIPASGTAIATYTLSATSPQVVGSVLETETYSVGANLITSDGSSFAATPATLTIIPISAN